MGLVAYAFLSCTEFEEACVVQEQQTRVAAVTRVRRARSARGTHVARGALVAAPRDQQDVGATVEFCDTATAADVPALRDVALTAPSPLAAGNAVRALGRLRAVAKDADVLALLGDPRERVRDETILALGESRDEAALDLLEPLARAGDEHRRDLAVRAVGRIGGERARAVLDRVASDPQAPASAAAFARAGIARSMR
jgi:HEAT repeat protein